MLTLQTAACPPLAKQIPHEGKRPHQKVRSGCIRCKARRVKCDEVRPQCAHCARHKEICIYSPPRETGSKMKKASTIQSMHAEQLGGSDSPLDHLDILNLELMHQWTKSSYQGFGDCEADRSIWQTEVTKMAFEFPWLMQGLLSVAALHLSRQKPDCLKTYLDAATHHQDRALVSFREIMQNVCSSVNAQNCHAVIAFAGLTVAYGFVTEAKHPLPSTFSWQGTPEWIKLLRGPRQALDSVRDWVTNGVMSYQLRSAATQRDVPASPHDQRLFALEGMINSDGSCHIDTYLETLRLLRGAFDLAYAPGEESGPKIAMYNWVTRVPAEFFDLLLDNGEPEALVLLAHLCVLVKWAAKSSWYMEGSGEASLSRICNVIPRNMSSWLEWPQHEIQKL